MAMKKSMALLAASLLFLESSIRAQQPPSGFQPYTPPVVGGLPPSSRGLEQPVYVAERAMRDQGYPQSAGPSLPSEVFASNGLELDVDAAVPSVEQMTFFDAGTRIAVVGTETITIGDLVPPSKLTPQTVNNPQFEMAVRRALVEQVTRKSLAQRFVSHQAAGKSKKEREEARKQIELKTTKMFFERYVPSMKQSMGADSDLQFQEIISQKGQTLAGLKREFAETAWARAYIDENVPEKPIVELSEMQDYYNDHLDEFRKQSRVRFQIMSAMFNKYPNKPAAYQAIAEMWNEVYFGGAPFDAVAKRKSSGINASQGGRFDWVTQGALKSKPIDKAIFENQVRGLSQVIEDTDGFHVVEVLEREEASIRNFVETQAEIKKQLAKQKSDKIRTEFIKKVREETLVYTQWPQDIPGSQDISQLGQ
jgi:hypothetical protein